MDEDEPLTALTTRNEITDIVIQRPEVVITPDMPIEHIGHVESILDNTVVIKSLAGKHVLDMGCLLVYDDRSIVGEVFETFGPVSHPYYSVRYNSKEEMDLTPANPGASVFFVPSYDRTQIVEVEKIKQIKGTDASNEYDEEINESDMEFSDDEEEMAHRKSRKQKKQRKTATAKIETQPKAQRPMQSYSDIDHHRNAACPEVTDTIDALMQGYIQSRTRPPVPRQEQSSDPTVKSIFSKPPPL
ncbi:NAF1-domain-containing protein [Hesseltinella vesiculosa]|uniref:H/ACA ribonucleoprotein complex subunit n=1 Tax=Hesseltinella vesiculosa TaxID=101127 RepID=A0A1X2GLD9_9FUNG|nr:NAF1-domain-containing protein [Hesseltinella vesiculosa]